MRYTLTADQFDTLAQCHEKVRSDYGGRAMYGEQCVAYTGEDDDDFIHDLAEVISEIAETDQELAESRLRAEQRSDSLGLRSVIYWPQIQVSR